MQSLSFRAGAQRRRCSFALCGWQGCRDEIDVFEVEVSPTSSPDADDVVNGSKVPPRIPSLGPDLPAAIDNNFCVVNSARPMGRRHELGRVDSNLRSKTELISVIEPSGSVDQDHG